jgi:hypothetical protein
MKLHELGLQGEENVNDLVKLLEQVNFLGLVTDYRNGQSAQRQNWIHIVVNAFGTYSPSNSIRGRRDARGKLAAASPCLQLRASYRPLKVCA